ncbi:excalibur calcium-binding domain-containing protein [Aureimonas frigidaquae]|uniref:excalibur calcium-binding domain-containing protein n=1 Tax=Aureimonas frigidaquae TaxID=424757 RepID=UPI000A76D984|nr:excalibur calcium-binding domain-containing protein [Aureimonas frigidaquae]
MRRVWLPILVLFWISPAQAVPGARDKSASPATELPAALEPLRFAQRRSCKAVSTCREAVEMWCAGYARADGDNDGIPCENVCRSKAEVDEIRAEIGC